MFKYLFLLLTLVSLSGCKVRSYMATKVIADSTYGVMPQDSLGLKLPDPALARKYQALHPDTTIQHKTGDTVISSVKGQLLSIVIHRKKALVLLHTHLVTKTYVNPGVQRAALRDHKDSIDHTQNTQITVARIAAHKDKPSFFQSLTAIVGQFKWIILGLVILAALYLIAKIRKWLP